MIDAIPFLMLGLLALLLFSGLPVAVVLSGVGVLFCLVGIAIGEMPWIALYNIAPKLIYAINGTPYYPGVVMLLFMGVALEKSGIALDMLRILRLLLRWLPGGLAVAVLFIGVLFAPAAGVVGASVVTLSLIALPAMLADGYRPSTASGTVAAAGTVGIILPPAIMLFFLAGQFHVPFGSMFMSTIAPVGILVCLYLVHAIFGAWRAGIRPVTANEARPANTAAWLGLVFRGLVLPFALIALVLAAVMAGWATPSQAGAVGALGGLILIAISGRLSWPLFKDLVHTTADLSAMVFFIIIAAAVFSYPFRYFGGDTAIADALASLGLGPWPLLFMFVGIVFLLGFFIDWIEITVITLPLFTPALLKMDFSAHVGGGANMVVWMAALTALVLQTSFLTPPFGFALFFLKGSAPPGVRLVDIYRGILPILVFQIIVIGLVLAKPEIVLWLPRLVYGNPSA
ncbi:MAG: TRAP transporter large permease subunit [Burkholderiaceae bacterium]